MPYSALARNTAIDSIINIGTVGEVYISLHTADPMPSGGSEVTGGSPAYARKASTVPAASTGTATGSQVTIDMPAGSATHWGAWDSAAGGQFIGGWPLPNGGVSYGSQGTVTITPTFNETGD